MQQKKAYPTKYYIRFITFIVFVFFTFFYRIKKNLPSEVKKLKSPYLLLSNHVGHWDPFVAGHFLPQFTHFVASDAVFRGKLTRFFLTRLGTIPKKKNIKDTKVIRDIVSVIKQGENVGIFPEAVRNWAGTSLKVDKSIVKLIKLLKVPVIVSVLKGMNLFNPRWARKLRYTQVEVEYKLLLNQEQIHILSEDEIYERIKNALIHDEVEYQRANMNKIYSRQKAKNINHALYVCPQCNAIDSFRVKENDFVCSACNYDIHIDKYGFFERINKGELFFDNIRDWYNWEEQWMIKEICHRFDNHYNGLIFEDKNSIIFHSKSDIKLNYIGQADVKLYIDRIELDFYEREELIVMEFDKLQTINPQVNERLEIYYNNEAYRIIGFREGVSALKWEVALNAIWQKLGQQNKLSPYIRQYSS